MCTHCHQSLLPIFPEINSFQPSAGPSSFSKAGLIRITKEHHGKFSHPSWLSFGWTAQGHPIGWTRLPFLRHSVPLSPGSASSLTSPADPLHACLLWDGPRTLLPFLCRLSLRLILPSGLERQLLADGIHLQRGARSEGVVSTDTSLLTWRIS